MSLKIRSATEQDLRMVVATWSDSFRLTHAAGLIAVDDWRDVMEAQIRKVLARPGVTTLVAYHPGETDGRRDLYGWLAVERDYLVPTHTRVNGRWVDQVVASWCPLVHYAYTLRDYREHGVQRALWRAANVDPAAEFFYTCRTPAVSRVAHKILRAQWKPLIARFPKAPIVEEPNPEPRVE